MFACQISHLQFVKDRFRNEDSCLQQCTNSSLEPGLSPARLQNAEKLQVHAWQASHVLRQNPMHACEVTPKQRCGKSVPSDF